MTNYEIAGPVNLTTCTTSDGLQLPGALWPVMTSFDGAVDAALFSHGSMGTFYGQPIAGLAQRFAAAGLPSMTLSNRGHDVMWFDDNGRHYGHALEQVNDCIFDFRAALDVLEAQGYRRIVLLGHSLSGVKSLYYAAHVADPRLVAVVSLSGPRLSGQRYRNSQYGPIFQKTQRLAEEMIASGRGDELFEAEYPMPSAGHTHYTTYRGWAAKFAGEDYDGARYAHRITVPLLMVVGDQEHAVSQEGFADDMVAAAINSPLVEKRLIPDCAHRYVGRQDYIAEQVLGWLRKLPA